MFFSQYLHTLTIALDPIFFVRSTFVVNYLHAKNFWPGPFTLGDMTFQICQKWAKIDHFVISPNLMLKK